MHAYLIAFALAQQIFPGGPLVQGGLADPREPRTAVGAITTDVFADSLRGRDPSQHFRTGTDLKNDVQAVVEFGTNFPLVKVRSVVVSLQAGVISRFRLEAKDNDELSNDFQVSLPINYMRGPYSARLRVMHRSGHLGDELVQNTTIRRLEFDHEEIEALLARSFGAWRVYAGGTETLASSYVFDRHGIQAGADGRWAIARTVHLLAGVDWQRHAISQGVSRLAAVGGVEFAGPAGRATLQARYLSGQTPIGEFFMDRERYFGLSLVLSR